MERRSAHAPVRSPVPRFEEIPEARPPRPGSDGYSPRSTPAPAAWRDARAPGRCSSAGGRASGRDARRRGPAARQGPRGDPPRLRPLPGRLDPAGRRDGRLQPGSAREGERGGRCCSRRTPPRRGCAAWGPSATSGAATRRSGPTPRRAPSTSAPAACRRRRRWTDSSGTSAERARPGTERGKTTPSARSCAKGIRRPSGFLDYDAREVDGRDAARVRAHLDGPSATWRTCPATASSPASARTGPSRRRRASTGTA